MSLVQPQVSGRKHRSGGGGGGGGDPALYLMIKSSKMLIRKGLAR